MPVVSRLVVWGGTVEAMGLTMGSNGGPCEGFQEGRLCNSFPLSCASGHGQ